jgi:type IV pilus assembly protein PilN
MIKINLLPRSSKKKEIIRRQLIILLGAVVVVLFVGIAGYAKILGNISESQTQIGSAEAEIKSLKVEIGMINSIKKLQVEVKKKLDVLSQLRRQKSGPAARLAALSDSVPAKLWLTKYTELAGNVSVSGVAFDEDLIALFMKNLQASGAFSNVELQVSEQAEIDGVKAKRFDLAFQIKEQKP